MALRRSSRCSTTVLRLLRALVIAFSGAMAVLAAPPATASDYVCFRFETSEQSTVYAQAMKDLLCVGSSIEGLDTAKPIRCPGDRISEFSPTPRERTRTYLFPEVDLPVGSQGITKVRGAIVVQRTRTIGTIRVRGSESAHMGATLRIFRQDDSGTVWSYATSLWSPAAKTPDEAPVISVPSMDTLKLTVETKIEDEKARIGLRVLAGEVRVREVRKSGKLAAAAIEVTDSAGNVVHSQEGDLEKFGFT